MQRYGKIIENKIIYQPYLLIFNWLYLKYPVRFL